MRVKPRLNDFLKKLKRGPAVVLPKDFGMIAAYAGVNRESFVVDIGGGSGFLALSLARIAKKVVTYERRREFAEIIKKNCEKVGLENVEIKIKDAKEGIEEKEVDLITLDTPEAVLLLENVYSSLKKCGYAVAYLPNIEQAKEFYLAAEKIFEEVFMLENIVREYEVREKGTRPQHFGLFHTAYLVFCRK
ncbi:MAG: methyltransferase domain-containing protein [Candidatus Anstonellales archaeon]